MHTQSKISLYDPSGQYTCMAHLLAFNVLLLPKDLTIIFISLFMMSAYSDFFLHFGNGTSTGSIGKNCLILPSVGKINDIYLKTSENGKNFMQ